MIRTKSCQWKKGWIELCFLHLILNQETPGSASSSVLQHLAVAKQVLPALNLNSSLETLMWDFLLDSKTLLLYSFLPFKDLRHINFHKLFTYAAAIWYKERGETGTKGYISYSSSVRLAWSLGVLTKNVHKTWTQEYHPSGTRLSAWYWLSISNVNFAQF